MIRSLLFYLRIVGQHSSGLKPFVAPSLVFGAFLVLVRREQSRAKKSQQDPHIWRSQPLYTVEHGIGGGWAALDIEEQYSRIYRYCYFRLRDRHRAEDITQETFLRWFASDTYRDTGRTLQYLYTIAQNLCADESRRQHTEPLPEDLPTELNDPLLSLALQSELDKLSQEDRELVLLRVVNEVPMGVLSKLYGMSRFALYRRLQGILKRLRERLEG